AVGQRRRGGPDAAAEDDRGVAAEGAVGQRRRAGEEAAAVGAGDVAPDRAVLDREHAPVSDDEDAAAVAAGGVAGHGGVAERPVPSWRPGLADVGGNAASVDERPVPDDRAAPDHQIGVNDQDPAADTRRVPAAHGQPLECDPDRTRGGAEYVEHPVLLLA